MRLHRHRWVAVDAHASTYVVFGGDCTAVLYRCSRCGAHRSGSINGHWTFAQLNGDPA